MTAATPLVAIVSSHGQKRQLPMAVAAQLEAKGFTTAIYADGDTAMLDADLILFMGSLASLRHSAALIEKAGSSRPPAIAWVSEPLPPDGLLLWAETMGVRTSAAHFGSRWIKPFIRAIFSPLDVLIHFFGQKDYPVGALKFGALRFCIDNLAWLKRGRAAGWLSAIAVSTQQKRLFLKNRGIDAQFVPVGQQAVFGHDLGLTRDVDVLFIGNLKSKSRETKLLKLKAEITAAGYTFVLPEDKIHGEARTALVNRARVFVHVHNYPWDTPWMRWCLGSANGAALASEPLSIPDPMRPDVDYISAPFEQLGTAIIALLADEPRRLAMVEACAQTIAAHMTLELSVTRLAGMISELLEQKRQNSNVA